MGRYQGSAGGINKRFHAAFELDDSALQAITIGEAGLEYAIEFPALRSL